MNDLLVALVQLNVVVGGLIPNARKIIRHARQINAQGASVIVFPELALSGYPPEDLVLKRHFLEECEKQVQRMAAELPPEAVVIVGAPCGAEPKAHNSAVIFHGGKVVTIYHKILLPNYGVFDEQRVFTPGVRPVVFQAGGFRIGLHICEDSWFTSEKSCQGLRDARLDGLINLSASPYHRGKLPQRVEALGQAAEFLQAPLLYCNLIGGQDELVFDGASMVLGADGKLLARSRQFTEDLLFFPLSRRAPTGTVAKPEAAAYDVVNIPLAARRQPVTLPPSAVPRVETPLDDNAEVYSALKLGLRDYVDKNGFSKVVVALSGGIDSAIVAALAVDALGSKRVAGVTMPSQYSSRETFSDAQQLAARLDIEFYTLPIHRLCQSMLEELTPVWGSRQPDTTEENIQARLRGVLIMALSNKFGWLVLTTGNKSELATGYCTLYGDMVGGFAVLKDVPKTLVFALARWRNLQSAEPVIPPSTIERPPSAELRPNQKDSDSLPPYDVLDPILTQYVELDLGAEEIIANGGDPETTRRIIRLVDRSEYKRRQGAPGIKITPKAFGRDRRMPITNVFNERTHEDEAVPTTESQPV